MFKKTIKYKGYNGEDFEDTFYFNLNKAELSRMELTQNGGMINLLKNIIETKDQKRMIEIFEEVIELSFGYKSADGKRFVKDPEKFKEFKETEAYVNMYMEMLQNTDACIAFFKGILPEEAQSAATEENIKKQLEELNK